MNQVVGGLLGGMFGGGKTSKVSTAPIVETEAEKKKAKLARSALLSTEGGIMGEELQYGQVGGRSTIFGN